MGIAAVLVGQARWNVAGYEEVWNGSTWVAQGAANDSGAPSGGAGGDLAGTYPNPTLHTAGPGATGPIGAAGTVPVVTIDDKGRVTALDSAGIAVETINTSSTATATTPTLGAAAQLGQLTADATVYVVVGTTGTLTIAIGPTADVAVPVVTLAAAVAGSLYTVRLPAGWYIAVTTTDTAAWTATAVTS